MPSDLWAPVAPEEIPGGAEPIPLVRCRGQDLEQVFHALCAAHGPGVVMLGDRDEVVRQCRARAPGHCPEAVLSEAAALDFAETHRARQAKRAQAAAPEAAPVAPLFLGGPGGEDAEVRLDALIGLMGLQSETRAPEETERDGQALLAALDAAPEPGPSPSPFDTHGRHVLSHDWLPEVFVALTPAQTAAEIPAHWPMGGWHACPSPAEHILYARRWAAAWGAELTGIGADTVTYRVARPPQSATEARALAQEHATYCPDALDQGPDSLDALASSLLHAPHWSFWWD